MDIDPVYNAEEPIMEEITSSEYMRQKRLAEQELASLKKQYSRCNRNIENGSHCEGILKKVLALAKEVSEKFSTLVDDVKKLDAETKTSNKSAHDEMLSLEKDHSTDLEKKKYNKAYHNNESNKYIKGGQFETTTVIIKEHKIKSQKITPKQKTITEETEPKTFQKAEAKASANFTTDSLNLNTKPIHKEAKPALVSPILNSDPPLISKNKKHGSDVVGDKHFGDGFYYSYQEPPKIHEELIDNYYDNHYNKPPKNLEQAVFRSSHQFDIPQTQHGTKDEHINKSGDQKGQDNIGVSGPFLTLCDQIARQNQNQQISPQIQNKPHTTPSGFAYYNGPQFQTIHQFSGRGQMHVPITGETMKASAQVLLNPGFSYSPNPICFYPAPAVQQYKIQQPVWTAQTQYSPNVGLITNNQGGFIYVPASIQSGNIVNSNQYVPASIGQSSNTRHNNPTNQNLVNSQPLFCSYLPSSNPQLFSAGHFRSSFDPEFNLENVETYNIPADTDIIYASYANQLMAFTNRTMSTVHNFCQPEFISCFGSNQCIPKKKWCDSIIDCVDGSDETACSCKSRLSATKLCDGYTDCPMGSDEIGCFGCDKFSYSCYSNAEEYNNGKQSSLSMCYSIIEKCDGIDNCLNGKDEQDCSMIVRTIGQHTSYMVSYTEGFLHRNYKGKWYPVCDNPHKWAMEACESEIGILESDPILSYRPGVLPGQYIQPAPSRKFSIESDLYEPIFSDSCPIIDNKKSVLYVKCPPMKCGVQKKYNYKSPLRIRKLMESLEQDIAPNISPEEDMRIVGGVSCDQLKWPFIVGMYRNGNFHCGGVIHNEYWIITAAHCVTKYNQYYYEIRAGMLRRYSYAPMSQIVKVSHVVVHESYDRNDMRNDLSLLRLENPLLFNRWVKPICLPGPGRTTTGNDWIWGPAEGTLCETAGWGAVREKGPDPDQLREVSVPIIGRCKHLLDREGEEICAGDKDGGRDACQGDSGGPLFCKSITDASEWYLAGIVSHGEGCARPDEPGVYTRVALFLDWIYLSETTYTSIAKQPLQECPGLRCVWGGGLCIPKRRRCDGIVDCLGGEDEINCEFKMDDLKLGSNHSISNSVENNATSKSEDKDKTTETPKIDFIFPSQEENHDDVKHTTEISIDTDILTVKPVDAEGKHSKFLHTTLLPFFIEHTTVNTPPIPSSAEDDGFSKDGKRRNASHIESLTDFNIPDKFLCKKILQTINIDHRCDTISDCEDGTDEENCTCREYLSKDNGKRICDGKVDCLDLSDEKDCLKCSSNEYACLFSKKCIAKVRRCDENFDCDLKEDELDCIALTDGNNVNLDVNLRPILNNKGIVCKNSKGDWNVLCGDDIDIIKNGAETAGQVCSILGFSGYSFFNVTYIAKKSINAQLHQVIQKDNILHNLVKRDMFIDDAMNEVEKPIETDSFSEIVGNVKKCIALYVECVPHSISNFSHIVVHPSKYVPDLHHNKIFSLTPTFQPNERPSIVVHFNNSFISDNYDEDDEVHWPWSASIYMGGKLICIGILLDKHWVLTESSCLSLVRLDYDYVTVVLGGSKAYLNIRGPYEQIIRVNCIHKIPESNTVLLYLEHPARYNRQCLPTYLPEILDTSAITDCFALSHNKFGKMQSLQIDTSKKTCFDGHKCFENKLKIITDQSKYHCDGDDLTRCGVVICKTKASGYYPSGFYSHRKGLCSFQTVLPVPTLSAFYKNIQQVIDYSNCEGTHPSPLCTGHRCLLGECLSEDKICNGKFDCHDGSEENALFCKNRKDKVCAVSDMKCKNGRCISKSKFCDHINDCGDLSDEPSECSCFTYYSATDSSKICDGIRNCWDKSDENPQYCRCKENTFPCGDSRLCVPKDFVCDKDIDCPNGEDEQYCYGLEHPSQHNDGFAQVIQQSYGIWHTKCFPRPHPPTVAEVKDMCRHIGYYDVSKATGRVYHESSIAQRSADSSNGTLTISYRQAPTKAKIVNKFSPLRVNPQLTLYIKPSRPIAQLVKWDESDHEKCFRYEIRCEE